MLHGAGRVWTWHRGAENWVIGKGCMRRVYKQKHVATAAWLQRADRDGSLRTYSNLPMTPEERKIADIAGLDFGSGLRQRQVWTCNFRTLS